MLDKSDIQQLRTLVHEEVSAAINDQVPPMIEGALEEHITPIREDIRAINHDMTKIRKDMTSLTSFFDDEYLELRRRVERIEAVLQLTPAQA
jgi:hypothetical protein